MKDKQMTLTGKEKRKKGWMEGKEHECEEWKEKKKK